MSIIPRRLLLLATAVLIGAGPAAADEPGDEEAPATAPTSQPAAAPESGDSAEQSGPAASGEQAESSQADQDAADEGDAAGSQPFVMLGGEVPPGRTQRLSWVASESFSGITVPTPVLVAHGSKPGPTLCLTAAVHGDELNGIEMVRRVVYGLEAEKMSGTVVGVPIVNLFGFRRGSRYLPDRRDLNRYFPGDPDGSSASRIAHAFFESVIRHCDALADLHTGSFHRTNLPQLRADLDNPEVLELSQGFGAIAVLQSEGPEGTLRRAATNAGVPAVTLEAGEPMRFQPEEVAQGVKGIRSLLDHLGIVDRRRLWGEPQPIYYDSEWVRADSGGILFSRVALGDSVDAGEVLGTVTDPVTSTRTEVTAPLDGRVLGMALNQVVIPGFAAYRIGIEKSREEVSAKAEAAGDDAPEAASGDQADKPDGKPAVAPEPDQRPD